MRRRFLTGIAVVAGALAVAVGAVASGQVDGDWTGWWRAPGFWVAFLAAAVSIVTGFWAQGARGSRASRPNESGPRPVVPLLRVANAPLLTSSFTGRDSDLAWLHEVVGGKDPKVAVVAGLGGAGKSSLVVKYLTDHQVKGRPVWWVTADTSQKVEDGLARAARLAGLAGDEMAPADSAALAVAWLGRQKDALLVLDNVDDVRVVEPVLRDLAGTPVRVIVTSRLAVGWNRLGAVVRDLAMLSTEEALTVLARTAGRGTAQSWDGAGDLVQEVGRLPLAVEQVGAYLGEMPHLTPAAFVERLRRTPREALGAGGYGSDAERTIARVWSVTLDRLATEHPAAIEVLRIVAWWSPDGFPRTLLDPVDGDESLRVLAAWSLARADAGTVRVHRLVQAVARTPDQEVPYRAQEQIAEARDRAVDLLQNALPDVNIPASWPVMRVLLPSIETLAQLTDADHDTQAMSLLLDGAATFLEGQGAHARAIEWFERALVHDERALGVDHPDTLSLRNNLAGAYESLGDLGRAVPLFERTLADRERVSGVDHPDTLSSRNNLAGAYRSLGDLGRAVPLFERTLADCERVLGVDHPETLSSRNNLAFAYESLGDLGRAVPLYERTLADRERVLGADHPDTLTSRNNLAGAYRLLGDLGRAVPLFARALADYERVLGADHPNTLNSRNNLAGAYRLLGDLGRAVPLYERTLAERERVLGVDHPDTLTSRNNLAAAYRLLGDLGRAVPLYERTLAERERVLGVDHPDTLTSRNNLAFAYIAREHHGEGLGLARRNVQAAAVRYGEDDRRTLDYADWEAVYLLRSGDAAGAAAILEPLLTRCERLLGADDKLTNKVRQRLDDARGQAS